MSPLVQSLVTTAWVDLLLPVPIALFFWWRLAVRRWRFAWRAFLATATIAFLLVAVSVALAVLLRHRPLLQLDWQAVSYAVFLLFMHSAFFLYLHSVVFPKPLNYTVGDEVWFGVLYCFLAGVMSLNISSFELSFGGFSAERNSVHELIPPHLVSTVVATFIAIAVFVGIAYLLSLRRPARSRPLDREDQPTNRVTLVLLIAVLTGVLFSISYNPFSGIISPHEAARGWIYEMDFGTGVDAAKEEWSYGEDRITIGQAIITTSEQREELFSRMEPGSRLWVEAQPESVFHRVQEYHEYEDDVLIWRTDSPLGLSVPGLTRPVTRQAFEAKYGPGWTSKLPERGSELERMILQDAGDDVKNYQAVVYKIGAVRESNLVLVFGENRLLSAFHFADFTSDLGGGLPLIPFILFILFYSNRKKQHKEWDAREAAVPPAE
jgi:hypothetical protein